MRNSKFAYLLLILTWLTWILHIPGNEYIVGEGSITNSSTMRGIGQNINGNVNVRGDLNWSFAIDVPAGAYYYRYAYRERGMGLIGSFRVTSGNDITFFIVDSENFEKLSNGQEFLCYLYHEKIGSLTWKFRVPYSDTWYIIFDNTYSFITTKHVEGWDGIDFTPPRITLNIRDGQVLRGVVAITATAEDLSLIHI